jgi:hypothetical protein
MVSVMQTAPYVHILLFVCPDCDHPIAISRISEKRNLEDIDAESLRIFCSYCYNFSNVLAVAAKKHYVEDWL